MGLDVRVKVVLQKKLNCLTIIRNKMFYFRIIINNSKIFRIKFRRSVKQPLGLGYERIK